MVTTKFVRNVNLNYYCHLVIINSNSQPMQYSRSFHFNLYIIFETKKEKEREKTIKLPTTWMRKSDIIYLEISTHVIHSLNNQNERRRGKILLHICRKFGDPRYRFINASRPIHPPIRPVSIIGISSEGGGGGGILAALPRNNYDRVARRLIAFNVQPSKLPRNR